MKDLEVVRQIQSSLEAVTGFTNPHPVLEFIVASERQNALLVHEENQEAEIAICLQRKLLQRLAEKKLPEDFDLNLFPDLSIVIEELSHFNTYCAKAIQEHEVSGLELEVQAEVDKFGVALDWLEQKNERQLKDKVFEMLFGDIQVGSWIAKADEDRYQEAHIIARNFCRSILEKSLTPVELRKKFQEFFLLPRSQKLSLKF